MKLSSILMAAAATACLGIGTIAQAAPTVTYTLVIGQSNGGATGVAGAWTLYADDSTSDNLGIVAMSVGICTNIGVPTVATDLKITNDMPQIGYTDSTSNASPIPLNAGFTNLRAGTAALYVSSSGPVPLTGSMDTTNSVGFYVIDGFGQSAGTFPAFTSVLDATGDPYDGNSTPTQGTWAAHLKIAHGTYNTTTDPNGPVIDPAHGQTAANVLLSVPTTTADGVSTGSASTVAAGISVVIQNTLGSTTTPEPASLGVVGLGVLTLLARRRRKA